MDTVYVRMNEAGFRQFVAGKPVTLHAIDGTEVKVILADIGWRRMVGAVAEAEGRAARESREKAGLDR